MSANPPEEINHRHEAIADEMLANPWATKGEIAEKLNLTQSWLSTVVNSGTFQAYLGQRRNEFNQELATQATRKSLEVGMKALDKAAEGLDEGTVDPVDVFDKALGKAGLSPKSGGSGAAEQTNTQNNYYLTATPGELQKAREQITQPMQPSEGSSGEEEKESLEYPPSVGS